MNEKIKNVLDSINFKNSYLERDSEDEECVVYNYFSNGIVFADNKERIREYTILLNVYSNKRIDFRNETGFPGMKVLQFAFDSREESDYLPHNYPVNSIAYTGTHDNDTFRGWFEVTGNREDVEYSKKYLKLTEEEGYNWGFIRGVWSSVSHTAIALMQDFLNLGNEARINYPSTLGGNWQWRVKYDALTDELAEKIYDITKLYGRVNINE